MSSCDFDLWPVDLENSWYIKCHVIKVCTKFERNRAIPGYIEIGCIWRNQVFNVFEEIDRHDRMLIDLLWSKSRIMRMSNYHLGWSRRRIIINIIITVALKISLSLAPTSRHHRYCMHCEIKYNMSLNVVYIWRKNDTCWPYPLSDCTFCHSV